MKVAILGFSREGRSTLRFLKRHKMFARRNDEIWVLDIDPKLKLPRGVRGHLGPRYLEDLRGFDIVFRSPGIPYNHPALIAARRAGVKFSSHTKLFFEHCPCPIVGVTGTKGKSTTTTLIYKLLKAAGRNAQLVGNVGVPALDALPKLKHTSIAVFELSSFQLQDLDRSPHIAVVLEMFPDHLDNVLTARHGTHATLAEYLAAKTNICRHQKRGDAVFYLAHNPLTRRVARHGHGQKIPVTERGFTLFAQQELTVRGLHNYRNAIVAAQVARRLRVPEAVVRAATLRFRGLEHRLELVRAIGAVEFYNDSQSTAPQPTVAAIRAFPDSDNVLIAGGYDKGLAYAPLAKALANSTVRLLILMGANKEKLMAAIRKQHRGHRPPYKIVRAATLRAAVAAAYAFARASRASRRRVILSPAAASFDMFKSYADRGTQFKQLVRRLERRSGS